jgi:hypothetical protein
MTRWRRHDTDRQALMREQLEHVLEVEGLSNDIFEVISKGWLVSAHANAQHGCLIGAVRCSSMRHTDARRSLRDRRCAIWGSFAMNTDNDSINALALHKAAEPPAGSDSRSDLADDPATASAHGNGADGNMAQLRQLLFGSQMREYDQRFKDLAERQATELERLRDEQQARVEQLDALVRGELDRLSGELRLEREERLSAARQLADQLETLHRDLARDLGARIDALTAALADESKDREAVLMAQATELSDALDARARALEAVLQQERDRLQAVKPSRDELAQLFTELASRLNAE